MTPELTYWMADLPAFLGFTMSGKSVQVVHGAPSQTNKFMWESLPAHEFAGEFMRTGGAPSPTFRRSLLEGWLPDGFLDVLRSGFADRDQFRIDVGQASSGQL